MFDYLEFDSALIEDIFAPFAGMVILERNDLLDAGIYKQFSAGITWYHVTIERRSVNRYSQFCSLRYGILFCMGSPNTMIGLGTVVVNDFMHLMSDVVAVF
jgi:hypothetical protein